MKSGLEKLLAKTSADELMLNAMIFDHTARLRAYEIVADVWKENISAQTA